jgi:hypothetical protein
VRQNGRTDAKRRGEPRRESQQAALIEQWRPAWLLLDKLTTRFPAAVSPTP